MAINIRHTFNTRVKIYYYDGFDYNFHSYTCGQMDDIAEMVSEKLIKHNFPHAHVCSVETDEILMMIERT